MTTPPPNISSLHGAFERVKRQKDVLLHQRSLFLKAIFSPENWVALDDLICEKILWTKPSRSDGFVEVDVHELVADIDETIATMGNLTLIQDIKDAVYNRYKDSFLECMYIANRRTLVFRLVDQKLEEKLRSEL